MDMSDADLEILRMDCEEQYEELRLLEQRNFSGISLGFGLKMRKLKFDYSFNRYTLASNTSMLGLTINFNDH